MSRVAKAHVTIPSGVEVTLTEELILVKGKSGNLSLKINPLVNINNSNGKLSFNSTNSSRESNALTGTFRQLVNNMVQGVTVGFEKKLNLIGVGYRASVQENKLILNVGYSHPVEFILPAGIEAIIPTGAPQGQVELILKGMDKQAVGQLAAEIRAVRPPEPYKGKGIRYANEKVIIKETKKK